MYYIGVCGPLLIRSYSIMMQKSRQNIHKSTSPWASLLIHLSSVQFEDNQDTDRDGRTGVGALGAA